MNIPINSLLIFVVIAFLSFASNESSTPELESHSIELGKKIYTSGIGDGESKIMAVVSGRDIPGSMMACINCHGKCGKGLTLQGVIIPDIRREHYIGRYMNDQSAELSEKAINSKLKKAIALGIKGDGENIHNLMPKYKMSMDDMNHLLAYLTVLGEDDNCKE